MNQKKDRLNKVMVIGATPSGISAVNKLGELGIPVTLVDTEPDLDEKLRQEPWRLDSGVPFNYAHRPGLLRILRNPAITCILPAEVTSVKHSLQGFSVTIHHGATYVNAERCLLCGKCEDICPVSLDGGGKAVSAHNRMRLPGRAVIDKRQMPLCQANCPLNVNVQAYVALTKAGKYREALDVIRQDNVLPSVCGRICTHPCEAACRRGDVDGSVSVRAIKRFLADQEDPKDAERWRTTKPAEARPEKIAIIGSGPAGLAAAAELARNGFKVTVFEKEKKTGGMLQYGIGEHRLPREILDKEIDAIKRWGVQFKTGSSVDLKKDLKSLAKKFNAVIIATGTWADRKLTIPGEDLAGIRGCVDYLTAYHRGEATAPAGKIAVIGDGNSAFDLARTLVRQGGDVTLVSWFPESMITADDEEVKGAIEEGIKFLHSCQTVEFKGKKGSLTALSLAPTKPGKKDAKGIAWPVIVPGEQAVDHPFDAAFVAVGQKGPLENLFDITVSEKGTVVTDNDFKTNIEGIYAAGDAVSGPASVVSAMAQGRRAAGTVIYDITGKKPAFMETGSYPSRPCECDFPAIPSNLKTISRAEMPEIEPSERCRNFHEVAKGLNVSQTALESERCLQCGVCSQCLECLEVCGSIGAIEHFNVAEEITEHVGVLILADPSMALKITGDDVIKTFGPGAAQLDVNAMMVRGFAAAAGAMEILSGSLQRSRGFGITSLSPDQGVLKAVRVGVFACRCNDSLGWMPEMDAYIKSLENTPDIVHAETVLSACVPEGTAQIVRTIREKGITRVVLASCVCCPLNFVCSSCTDQKSRLKTALFNGTGISRAMVETCNLRGEVLRLVQSDPVSAVSAFKGLIDRSIDRSRKLSQHREAARNYNFTTAVIGDSEGALNSASILARSGFEVVLFRIKPMAGTVYDIPSTLHCIQDAKVTEVSGTLGDFRISFQSGDTVKTLQAGSIIMGERTRKTLPFTRMKGQPHFPIEAGIQHKDDAGRPFLYPGFTSIPGLLLSDPPNVQGSKLQKGAAAAMLAAAIMPRGARQSKGYTVTINQDVCRGCGRCVTICPYCAISMGENEIGGYYAVVDEAFCKGCGNCTSVCPSNAADSPYRNQAFFEEIIEELLA